jgi:hypothetical protein
MTTAFEIIHAYFNGVLRHDEAMYRLMMFPLITEHDAREALRPARKQTAARRRCYAMQDIA